MDILSPKPFCSNNQRQIPKMANKGLGIETEDQVRLRFQIELEFVQCLANPNYLNFLAQRGYFKDEPFIHYLKYLLYWKEPQYAKYLKYPMCLHFLDLLQYEHFRKEIVNSQCTKFIDDQQVLLWQHYTRKRSKLLQTAHEQHQNNNISNNNSQNNGGINNIGSGSNGNSNHINENGNGLSIKNEPQ